MRQTMKSSLKWAARKIGYDLVQYTEMPERPFSVLKVILENRMNAGLSTRIIQIGANDGVRNDPIRESVIKYKLPCLFVEPLPDLHLLLQSNYKGHPGAVFEQCAIGNHDGETTLYRIQPHPELPDWLQGIASFNRDHLSHKKFGVKGLEKHIIPVSVPVLTFATLVKKHNITQCDLLQIDTEGYDCQIVKSALETGLRPAIINYEYIHTNPSERANCKRLLASHGYDFLDIGRDTLALHQPQ